MQRGASGGDMENDTSILEGSLRVASGEDTRPSPPKCGPSIIFMFCDIVPQRVKPMRRISD